MKKLLGLTLFISSATLIGFWVSRQMCMRMLPSSLKTGSSWYQSLGLNPEQSAALKKLDSSYRAEAEKLCMSICKGRMELMNVIREDHPDSERINAKIEELGALQISLEKSVAKQILAVKENLSAEQRKAYVERLRTELQESIRQCGYGELLRQV